MSTTEDSAIMSLDPVRAPELIMFVRHGEKPSEHGAPHGINHHGEHDDHSLSVRGWMRAGALGALLSHAPTTIHPGVLTPQRILATKPSPEAKSHREVDTAQPIARRLHLVVESDFAHVDEAELRQSVLTDSRNTLVVWHHGNLGHLVRGFPIANINEVPERWPEDRFDLIWVLNRSANQEQYTYSAVDQALLDGDAPD